MSDLVKLLNESKNGYLSMCIRLLNLFEAEKVGGGGGGGHSVVFFGLFCWVFFSLSYVASHTKLTAALEETIKFAFKYIQTEDHRLYLDLMI